MTSRPLAILFDHDGVLVASEPLHWVAWEKLLKELGLPPQQADFNALVGKTAPQILATLLDRYRPGWNPKDYDLNALALRKNDYYLQEVPTLLRAYPGVRELLEWLRSQGIRRAVVSNARKRELESALKVLGLYELFDEVISRDEVPVPKPDPGPYLYGAASLGVEPSDCLVVEDSPPGLEAGLMANIPCAAVMTSFKREILEAPVPGRPDLRPVWVGPSIQALFEWLRELAPRN